MKDGTPLFLRLFLALPLPSAKNKVGENVVNLTLLVPETAARGATSVTSTGGTAVRLHCGLGATSTLSLWNWTC